MIFKFYKYQGTGNDFIIFDGVNEAYPSLTTEEIAKLCDRRFGIGADGLMILLPSDISDFKMLYYNSDGNESTMCGNGGRCISHLAWRNNVCKSPTIFEAIDGMHQAEITDEKVKLQMMSNIKTQKNENGDYVINTGSPHYIHFSDVDFLSNVVNYGKEIRYNDEYKKEGINVNLASWNDNLLNVATYERGVEDETLSCGTGVTAAAIATNEEYKTTSPIEIKTKGGNLKVYFEKSADVYNEVYLEGPIELVFEGQIEI